MLQLEINEMKDHPENNYYVSAFSKRFVGEFSNAAAVAMPDLPDARPNQLAPLGGSRRPSRPGSSGGKYLDPIS